MRLLTACLPAVLVVLVALLAACGAGPNPPPGNGSVAKTLSTLGVDTTLSARSAPDGSALGADDAPLGAAASFGGPLGSGGHGVSPTMELVIARNFFDHDTLVVEQIEGAHVTPVGGIDPGTEEILVDLTAGNAWIVPDHMGGNYFQTLRDVAAGDLDGDGFDEIAAIYIDEDDSGLKLRVFQDDAAGYASTTSNLGPGASIRSLKLIAFDDDGDGVARLLAALSYDDGVELIPLTRSGPNYSLDLPATIDLPQVVPGSRLYVRLAAGQLDYDNALELGVVVNEAWEQEGTARYYLFDDANAGRALLRSGPIEADVDGLKTAAAADIGIADVDGDGLGEVVLAGPPQLAYSCSNLFHALTVVLDDATNDLAELAARHELLDYQNCSSGDNWRRLFVFVATPDLDGDGVHEITVNHRIYADLADSHVLTPLTGVQLPAEAFLSWTTDYGQYLSVATFAVLAADVTGDGRDDLMVYHPNRTSMGVWGLSAIANVGVNGWAELSAIATPGMHNGNQISRPILVAANVDADGPVLRYSAGSHQLVFTEPIVIAAMAAPPCHDHIAQNVAACVTRFGKGTSQGADASLSVTVRAGTSSGVESSLGVPVVGEVGIDIRSTVSLAATVWAGTSYTVEKTVTYTSGPLEDAVVFTSIPHDIYRYDILSHPDPELVGKQVVIRVPREPITMIAERGFFSSALPETREGIGANVFDHTPGQVNSYPSASRRNSLLALHGGLQFGPAGVGQGSGDTQLEIDVSSAVSAGGALALEYDWSVEATAGVFMHGYSVGYGAEAALSFTSGTQTTYTGSVGSIAAADYSANAYQWGIFTYVQQVGEQRFEVINYWVE